jgi:hypothetical protein
MSTTLDAPRTKVKCRLEAADGQWVEKIPAWIKWATQEWNEILFNGKSMGGAQLRLLESIRSGGKY